VAEPWERRRSESAGQRKKEKTACKCSIVEDGTGMKLHDIYQYIEENCKMEYVFPLNIWQDFARWAKNA
jgi:hypothetical protein